MSGAAAPATARAWTPVCVLEDIPPDSGTAALIDGAEVAIFRVADAVYAIGNYDPASEANVLGGGLSATSAEKWLLPRLSTSIITVCSRAAVSRTRTFQCPPIWRV